VGLMKNKWEMDYQHQQLYPPDVAIAGVGLLFFLLSVLVQYFVAWRLFDKRMATFAVALMLICDQFWRFSMSGLPQMLMLFLFSDVAEPDAPTLIRISSHLDVAKILAPAGGKGLSFMELAGKLDSLPKHEEALATGKAGTVYLCHPFIVHAAQNHHGVTPKFMAQPPLVTKNDFNIYRPDEQLCPVEKAIVKGMRMPEY